MYIPCDKCMYCEHGGPRDLTQRFEIGTCRRHAPINVVMLDPSKGIQLTLWQQVRIGADGCGDGEEGKLLKIETTGILPPKGNGNVH